MDYKCIIENGNAEKKIRGRMQISVVSGGGGCCRALKLHSNIYIFSKFYICISMWKKNYGRKPGEKNHVQSGPVNHRLLY